jgi:hypothetical protein
MVSRVKVMGSHPPTAPILPHVSRRPSQVFVLLMGARTLLCKLSGLKRPTEVQSDD